MTADSTSIRDVLRARPGDGPVLPTVATDAHPLVPNKRTALAEIEATAERLGELQERLWAERTRSVLVVLQGMDTSGKGGTIEHVFQRVNPAGLDVAVFKKPTDEELAHHFLWRIERQLPDPGEIVIFDRSHYEDVLIVRVHDLVPPETWQARYDEIVAWEREVADAGTAIVKIYLHISYEEQRERLMARLDDPNKHWKFREGDIDERRRWSDYMAAYEDVIARCDADHAPWYVVPADRKWYRNWGVARLVAETLEALDPRYPDPGLDVARLKERLRPPN